ncbi:lipopolysaccharide core heptose(II) kinase RfaY [Chaetomidium leptoderma]|uniref:Lipopolysaccharide core heptose(II) kinase RfaY n=1 Tax=Chaetomidium leptoderma TaxID=669021 RepID=A0AAN7A056_9PEZI|nr:lipopolysaccharide core heptose(II) kinase RfaY [Chaetomidium leptoderma]
MDVHNPQTPAPPVGNYEIRLPQHKRHGEPEHYQLSAARLRSTQREPPTKPVQFWFRTRYVSALASEISNLHPHVLGLYIRPSMVANLIASTIRLLPTFVQSRAQTVFPEWFLPDHVILKTQKPGEEKEIMEEYFDIEIKAYTRLKPLQGVVIPRFYGCVRYNGTRAMILEHLGGISLASPEGAMLRLEELSTLLQPCFRALHAFDVHQDDSNLSNFQLVDGRIMVLDLESAVFHYSADDRAFFLASSIGHLADTYLAMQAYYWHEGSLEAA